MLPDQQNLSLPVQTQIRKVERSHFHALLPAHTQTMAMNTIPFGQHFLIGLRVLRSPHFQMPLPAQIEQAFLILWIYITFLAKELIL